MQATIERLVLAGSTPTIGKTMSATCRLPVAVRPLFLPSSATRESCGPIRRHMA